MRLLAKLLLLATVKAVASSAQRSSSHDFTSTVIPCPYAKASATTITQTDQPVLIAATTSTIAGVRRAQPTSNANTPPTIIIKKWSAQYKDIGAFAIPGYDGSGLCEDCVNGNQVVTLQECTKGNEVRCTDSVETWQ